MALAGRGVLLRGSDRQPGRGRLVPVGYAALVAIVAAWTWRTFHTPPFFGSLDFGGFYQGGQLAWATGHPETAAQWTGTPLLALLMGLIGRAMSLATATSLMNGLNVALVVGCVAAVLRRLRGVLSPAWWWVTAFALVSFGPVMSTVWWKQINLPAVVLCVGGFDLLRRQRIQAGSALIGLSVAFKPLAILLPFVLLARRETRRAGAWTLGYIVVLTVVAQVLLAVHAGSASALNPFLSLKSFADKTQLTSNNGYGGPWACYVTNFAPGSLLCRLGGTHDEFFQRAVVIVAVALLGLWVIGALRGQKAASWEVFAFTCAISPMLSPIAWSHYQVMLAPLFVLLLVRFTQYGAEAGDWAGLAIAFVLASLLWLPYNTPLDPTRQGIVLQTPFDNLVTDVAMFAQYVLIVTGVIWYRRSDRASARPAGGEALYTASSPSL